MGYMVAYIILVNVFGFIQMGLDKYKARKHAWRIPEARLFSVAVIGGSIGSIVGMYVFHHKTKHWYFVWGMPAIAIVQAALLVYLKVMY